MVWTSDATRYILPGRGHGIRPKKCWKNYISWPTWEHPIVVPDELKEVLSCGPDKWKKLHGWMDGKVIKKKRSPKLPWHSCLWCVYVNFWTQLKMLITVFWFSFRSKIRHFNTHCDCKTVTFPIHFYFLWSQVSFKVLLPSWTIVAKNRSQSSVKHACK